MNIFKPFLAYFPILNPLKTPENQKFFCVFRVYEMGKLARNGLTVIVLLVSEAATGGTP